MCGIFGARASNATNKTVKGLKLLEYRGYDSAGVAILRQNTQNNGKNADFFPSNAENSDFIDQIHPPQQNSTKNSIEIVKIDGRVDALKQLLTNSPQSDVCIGHTRWATHGKVCIQNAHPFLSNDGRFALVHNGILDNYVEIKQQLQQNGVQFFSETDSEVAVQLLSQQFSQTNDVLKAVLNTANTLKGSFALLITDTLDNCLYAVKHGSPLCIGEKLDEQYICSDITTLRHFVSSVAFVENQTVAKACDKGFLFFDFDGKPKTTKRFNLPLLAQSTDGSQSFMEREIKEIPKRIVDTLNTYSKATFAIPQKLTKKAQRIYLVGCGTAFHSGLATSEIFRQYCNIDVFCVLASEFVYSNFIIDKNTIVVLVSQSGETADTLKACEFANSHHAFTLAVTNVANSSICFAANAVCYISAGQEIAVASTKAYNCQLVALTLLALDIAVIRGGISVCQKQEILKQFGSLAKAVEKTISNAPQILSTVENHIDTTAVFFLGKTSDLATAAEASLKLKEISYIHSEAYASGELKHGTLALIEKGVTVVVVACQKQLLKKYYTAICEVLSRGAQVLVVSPHKMQLPTDSNITVFALPQVEEIFYPILAVVPLQFYAFFFSQLKGCDTDKPRNLAKSVTVE